MLEIFDDIKSSDEVGTIGVEDSALVGSGLNPNREADVISIAQQEGMDVGFLKALNPEQLRAVQNRRITRLPQESALRDYYSDPAAVAISGNDVGLLQKIQNTLAAIPDAIQDTKDAAALTPKALSLGWEAGKLTDNTGRMFYASMWEDRAQIAKRFGLKGTDEEMADAMARLTLTQQAIKNVGSDESLLIAMAGATGELAGQLKTSFTEGAMGEGMMGGLTLAAVGVAAAPLIPVVAGAAPITIPLAASLATGAALGAQAGLVRDSYVVEAGHAFQQFKELKDINGRGLPADVAKSAAVAVGMINAGIEGSLGVLGLKYLGQLTPQGRAAIAAAKKATSAAAGRALLNEAVTARISQVLSNYGKGVLAETATEIGQEIVPILLEEIAKEQANETGTNYFTGTKGAGDLYGIFDPENTAVYAEIGKKTALGAIGIGAPAAFAHVSSTAVQARRAQTFVAKITDVREQIKGSETLKHSATQASKALKAAGLDQQVWIDAANVKDILSKFPESFEALGIDKAAVENSIQNDKPLQFDVADMPTKLNDEQFKYILDRTSGEIDGVTAQTAKDFDVKTELSGMRDVIKQLNDEQSAFNTRMTELTGKIQTIANAKGWANDYASNVAQTIESFAFRHAITEKQDAADFVNRLDIEDLTGQVEMAGAQPTGLEQIRTGSLGKPGFQPMRPVSPNRDLTVEGAALLQGTVYDDMYSDYDDAFFPPKAVADRMRHLRGTISRIQGDPDFYRATLRALSRKNKRANEIFKLEQEKAFAELVYSRPEWQSIFEKSGPEVNSFMDALDRESPGGAEAFVKAYEQAAGRRVAGRTIVADNNYLVKVFNDANLSTILHELGHVFLSEMEYLDSKGIASKRMKADLAKIKAWSESGKNKDISAQELFARSFEKYLRAGIAPSSELRAPFERYRDWLKTVYKTTKDLSDQAKFEVNYRPEIAEIFDRMLATDEQIDVAAMDINVVVNSKDLAKLGMTPKETEQAQTLLRAMQKNAKRRLQWEKERSNQLRERAWRKEALGVVAQTKVFTTRDALKAAPLDTQLLRRAVGKKAMEAMRKRNIGTFKNGTGLDPALAAQQNGYDSASTMVSELLAAPTKASFVRDFISQKRAEFEQTDISAQETLMFEEKSAQYLEAVGKVLARQIGKAEGRQSARALKQWADREIGQQKIDKATAPNNYAKRFRAAMARQRVALRKSDYATALTELDAARREMAKGASAREARRYANAAAKRITRQARSLTKVKSTVKIEPTFKNNFIRVAAQLGLVRTQELPVAAKTLVEVMEKYYGSQEDTVVPMLPPPVPAVLSNGQQIKKYKSALTLDQFREVDVFASWLFKTGVKIEDGTLAELDGREADIVNSLATPLNQKTRVGPLRAKDSFLRKLSDDTKKALAHMMTPDMMFRMMDEYAAGGPHMKILWNNINRHLSRVANTVDGLQVKMKPIADYLYKRARETPAIVNSATMGRPIPAVPETMRLDGQSWNFERIFMIALNQGNTGNREAILNGYGLSQNEVNQLLTILTDEDWDATEKILDIVDSQWGLISSAYQKLHGLIPKKVQAETFFTPSGREMAGGYFPLKFDRDLSIRVDERAQFQDIMSSVSSSFYHPAPASGMVMTRKGSGGLPVSLSINTIADHLQGTSLYGHMAPVLNDIDRITRNPTYRAAVVNSMGAEIYNLIRPYLQDIARGGKSATPSVLNQKVQKVRSMISAASLTYKLIVAAKQFPGYITFANRFGWGKAIAGAIDFMRHPVENFRATKELSAFMRHRGEFIDETLAETTEIGAGKDMVNRLLKSVSSLGFAFIQGADAMITFPAWHAAFLEGQTKFNNLEDAILYADDLVAATQPSSRVQDKAAFQRDKTSILMMFNFFRGWAIKYTNELVFQTSGVLRGKIKPFDYAKFVAMEAVVAPLITYSIATALRKREFEKDEAINEVLTYQLAGLPFVGEIVNVLTRLRSGTYTGGIFDTPVTQISTDFLRYAQAMVDDDEDRAQKTLWAFAQFASFYFKVPATRLYGDLQEGRRQYSQSDDLRSLLFPDPRKKQEGRRK